MKKINLIGGLLIAGIASAAATSTTSTTVITKMTKGEEPIKVNGVYGIKNTVENKAEQSYGLHIPGKIKKAMQTKENVKFALDSLVGRMENGDYTVKETYRYDNDGNSLEANYYNWDYATGDWGLNQKITADWDSDNRKTSEETLFFSLWGDNGSRNLFFYDTEGKNVQTDMYMLEGEGWVPSQRSFYKYDSYGQMTEELIQVPGNTQGEWVNFQKILAEWTPTGKRTLAEAYSWDGTDWVPSDGRLIYEFDDEGRLTLFLSDSWINGKWQHFHRVVQKWGEFGMIYQSYELWNESLEDWSGTSLVPSSYATLTYDEKGRLVSETGYTYDLESREWKEANRTESIYTELEDGITHELKTTLNIPNDLVVNEVIREYNSAGNDTYYKEKSRKSLEEPLLPMEEKFITYAQNGKTLMSEEDYIFAGEDRYAYVKQWHEYDTDGYPEQSWYQHGSFYETGEGTPDDWNNYSHFTYEYENGVELSRMCYFWQDGEYVSGWGEAKDFNFNVAISECLFWMNKEIDSDYQITALRRYSPEGKDWTYEEGIWYYSELTQVGIDPVNKESEIKVYPNPATDYIHVDCNEGSKIDIYSIQGALIESSFEHTIDVSGLTKGIYIVNVEGKSTRLIKK